MNKTKLAFLALALAVTAILPVTNNSSLQPPPLTARGGGEEGGVIIEARAALVFDLLTEEIIFEKNADEPLPLASLTKIISSLVVADHIDLNEKVRERRAEDLLAKAMGESSNDAMTALVEHMGDEKWFLELMRQKTKELGAKTMSFENATGLDIKPGLDQSLTQARLGSKERASNFGSAWDIVQVVKNSIDSIIWQIGNKKGIKNTNILIGKIAGIEGSKTGFTDKAGGNLVLILERPIGKPKLIIILGSTILGRFEDARKLVTLLK